MYADGSGGRWPHPAVHKLAATTIIAMQVEIPGMARRRTVWSVRQDRQPPRTRSRTSVGNSLYRPTRIPQSYRKRASAAALRDDRQVDRDRRPLARGRVDLDVAAGAFDERVDDREAEAGALLALGREVRFEDVGAGGLVDAGAVVADAQEGVAALGAVDDARADVHGVP